MDEGARTGGTHELTNGDGRDPDAIRRHIEATRAELGDTVAALAVKADVKSQARERMQAKRAQMASRMPRSAGQAVAALRRVPPPVAALGVLAIGVLVGRVTARRKRRGVTVALRG
jgi:Protein of unknown function (DUF3618)